MNKPFQSVIHPGGGALSLSACLLAIIVTGCAGGSTETSQGSGSTPVVYTVGGMVAGLTGTGLVLENNVGDLLPVTGNGVFTFSGQLADGGSYNVRVHTQPAGANGYCGVANGWGTIAAADVVTVAVNCVPYQVAEYPVPGDSSGILHGPDGNLWGMSRSWDAGSAAYLNNLYRMDLSAAPVAVPVSISGTLAAASIFDFTAGPDGQIWALSNANIMARSTLAGVSANIATLPGTGSGFIALGPVDRDGQVWFWRSPTIGRMNPSGTVTLQQDIADVGLGGMVLGPDGNIWFTTYGDTAINPDANSVRFINTAGQITTYPLPANDPSHLGAMAVGPDGNLWVVDRSATANRILKVTPSGNFTAYPLDVPGLPRIVADVTSMAPGPDGAIWFTGSASNQAGRMTTDGALTMFGVPTAGSFLRTMTAGPDGRMWFAESGTVGAVGGLAIPTPSNNNFADAIVISGASGHLLTNNLSATAETGEPAHAGVAAQKTLWWRWTAPADGQLTINTHGSSHETVIGVYTGATLNSLTPVAQGHQPGNGVSFTSLAVVAGTEYVFAIDGYNGASGVLILDWRMP